MKTAILLAVTVFGLLVFPAAFAAEEGGLDRAKQALVQEADGHITMWTNVKNCASAATTKEALGKCREEMKKSREQFKTERKDRRKEMIDKRIQKLQEQKGKLEQK